MKTPFFSIITVSFRAEETIAETIRSVLGQDFTDYEIIVKDGCSDDNTLQQIPQAARVRVYSQPDKGIYDAMNQGVEYSSGQYLLFLNCGDTLASSTVLSECYEALKDSRPAVAYGNYKRGDILHRQPLVLTPFYLYRTPLCHQSIFFEKESFLSIGGYDTQYKILGDYDAELKLFLSHKTFMHLNVVVCRYLGGGVSEKGEGVRLKYRERAEILRRHYDRWPRISFHIICSLTMPKLRQKLFSDNCPACLKQLYQKAVNAVNCMKL